MHLRFLQKLVRFLKDKSKVPVHYCRLFAVMSAAIRVKDLHVQYRDKKGKTVDAVRGLTFEVQPGEIVGFLGPNGAGKSSTLKTVMGFVEQKSGQCEVFGVPSTNPDARKNTGFLPEVAMYYPFLTPLETLTLYGELQGLRGKSLRDQAMELLEQVGMAHAAKLQNRQLSKGMMQRVGIAQALLGQPKLLVLDEVTSGLDPIGRQELRQLLLSKQKEGVTLFFSSHELAEVEQLCNRLLLIHKGKLIEERKLNDLMEELRKFELRFTGNASMVGLTDDLKEQEGDVVWARFESKENLLAAIQRVQSAKGNVIDVVAQEGSLENYFIETIGRAA